MSGSIPQRTENACSLKVEIENVFGRTCHLKSLRYEILKSSMCCMLSIRAGCRLESSTWQPDLSAGCHCRRSPSYLGTEPNC